MKVRKTMRYKTMCKVRLSEGEKARCKSVCSTLPSKQQGEGEYVYILCFIYEQLH